MVLIVSPLLLEYHRRPEITNLSDDESDETLFISIACPLSYLPRDGGDKRGGSLDSSLVAAFAALGSLRFYFAAVSYRFPDSSSSEKS